MSIFVHQTLAPSTVSGVRVINVKANSFDVEFDGVAEAMNYTVRVYFNGTFTDTGTEMNVTVYDVAPLDSMNEYLVSVAYNTPAQSDFSTNVSSRKCFFFKLLLRLLIKGL